MDKPTITLINCDCIDFMRTMKDKSIDLVFADPPFNIGKKYGKQGDKRTDYNAWCELWITECFRILKDAGSFYLMTLPRHLEWILPIMALRGVFVNLIKWRNVSSSHFKRSFWGEYQPICLYAKTKEYIFNTYAETIRCSPEMLRWGNYSTEYKGQLKDYWDDIPFVYAGSIRHREAILQQDTNKKAHPCQMPEGLPKRAIRFSTNDDAVIFDPFMGSGTTGVACKLLRRSFIGCEISKEYFELAKRRIDSTEWGLF